MRAALTLAAFASVSDWSHAADPATTVVQVPAAEVDAAFRRGLPLIEQENYKINASRRDTPGEAEIHTKDTDVFYVLDGAATLVVGGNVVEPRPIALDEIRGTAIVSGEAKSIRKGDVVVVPRGVPHWFKQIERPVVYFVVKVSQ